MRTLVSHGVELATLLDKQSLPAAQVHFPHPRKEEYRNRWQSIHLTADATIPPYNSNLVPSGSTPPSTCSLLASGDYRCGSFLATKPALAVALLSQPRLHPSWAIEWQHLIYPSLCQEAAQSTFPAAGGAANGSKKPNWFYCDISSPLGPSSSAGPCQASVQFFKPNTTSPRAENQER